MRSLFQNKTLQLRVVNVHDEPKIDGVTYSKLEPESSLPSEDAVVRVIKQTAACTAGVVATYVVADAVRQIAIYAAMQKLTVPQYIQLTPESD